MRFWANELAYDVLQAWSKQKGGFPSCRKLSQTIYISKSEANVLLNGRLKNPKVDTLILICEFTGQSPGKYFLTE